MILRYLVGILLAAIALVPIGAGAGAVRRRLLPSWVGPPARLVEVVLGVTTVVVVGEILGALGVFWLPTMVVALAGVGSVGFLVARRSSAGDRRSAPEVASWRPTAVGRGGALVTVGVIAVVTASWSTRAIEALRRGMTSIDTLWYHMPVAARFAQTGSVLPAHYFDNGPVTAFYPASTAILHGFGILLLDGDILSPLLNMVWLAVALLAAWCIGRPFGVGPLTLTGAALVLASPGLVATQPGGAYNDVFGLAMLLAAVAILVNGLDPLARSSVPLGSLGIAALAAGLAGGTKFIFLGSVAALTVGVLVVAPKGTRLRWSGVWLGGLAVAGSFWYLRNLAVARNPLPALEVHLGPLSLPSAPDPAPTSAVAEYVLDGAAWSDYLLPGLDSSLGPGWWALMALTLTGMLVGILRGRDRLVRMVAAMGLVSLVVYLLTPQNLGVFGAPTFFRFQVRHAAPALIVGLIVLPLVPALTRAPRRRWLLAAYALVLAATQLDPAIWPTGLGDSRLAEPVKGLASVAGLTVGAGLAMVGAALVLLPVHRLSLPTPRLVAIAVATVLLVVAGGGWLQQRYTARRYARDAPRSWAADLDLRDERIGLVGLFVQQYPFYGPDLSNYVQYVGERGADGNFGPLRTCEGWRRALNRGDYSYVLISPAAPTLDAPPEERWISRDPGATLVRQGQFTLSETGPDRSRFRLALYRLDADLDPRACDELPPSPDRPRS